MPASNKPRLQILPSLLAADFGHLADACLAAERAAADGLHLDVMDGHFVPNLTMGPDIVRMARRTTKLPLSVHLMCTRPAGLLDAFLDAGSDLLMVHVEAHDEPAPLLERIRARGRRAGVVLNPETPTAAVRNLLPLADEILLMTVHPGFGGQPFLDHVLPKIAEIRAWAPQFDLSVDGGITQETARMCAAAGANVLIAGTSLYRAPDMAAELARMRESCAAARHG
ncbi:MAG TPA: ribulose-phosphate 3-epimerase [Kiritimatiellia bacterium]|nr:ribulose-phosphate 3-epimerase [Kiritimatiellia bacterium]